MTKECDHKSVGVLLRNERNELALLERGRFPIGIAPPAGHVDDHGTPEQAAIEEVSEEVGVIVALDGLKRTAVRDRRVGNVCRRENGDHHVWNVYEAAVTYPVLHADPDETKGAAWYAMDAVQELAARTKAYQEGRISEQQWAENPGLEEVWLAFLTELGYVR
jgi:8-oxo-dGTP pyrophosphatase MutT (NUDIX family)